MKIVNLLDWEPTAQSYKAFNIELPTDTQLVCISSNKREDEKYPYKEFIGYCDYKPGMQLKKTEYYHYTIIGQYCVFWFEGYEFEHINVKEGKEIQFPYPVYINAYGETEKHTEDIYYKVIGINDFGFKAVQLEHTTDVLSDGSISHVRKITDYTLEFDYFDDFEPKEQLIYQTKEDFDSICKIYKSELGL